MEASETKGGADGAAALTRSDPSWRKESVFLRSDPAFRLLPAACCPPEVCSGCNEAQEFFQPP